MARANTGDGTQFVYVRQSNATSTARVTTHLALNTGQTTGYTYDDADPALGYTGTRTHAGPSAGFTNGDWDSTESYSTQAGASMSVTVTGTGIQWIGPKNTNGGIADVFIDGNPAGTATIGGTAVALLYGDAGTDGETVLRYATQPRAGAA